MLRAESKTLTAKIVLYRRENKFVKDSVHSILLIGSAQDSQTRYEDGPNFASFKLFLT